MRLRRFLSIYYSQMATHFIFLCLIEGLLYIFEVNRYLMIYLLVIGILLELIYLGQQYMKKFRYYKEMTIKLDMLDQKNMLSEMMERPDFFEGEFIYDILQSCNKSMNDEILQYRTEAAGYREYIEMWMEQKNGSVQIAVTSTKGKKHLHCVRYVSTHRDIFFLVFLICTLDFRQ